MRRLCTAVTAWLALSLLATPAAFAGSQSLGRGTYGEVTDKVVTNVGFALIIGFPLFIFAMSMIQLTLDRRKDARKAAAKARQANAEWRGGW